MHYILRTWNLVVPHSTTIKGLFQNHMNTKISQNYYPLSANNTEIYFIVSKVVHRIAAKICQELDKKHWFSSGITFKYVNRCFTELWNYVYSELIYNHLHSVGKPESEDKFWRGFPAMICANYAMAWCLRRIKAAHGHFSMAKLHMKGQNTHYKNGLIWPPFLKGAGGHSKLGGWTWWLEDIGALESVVSVVLPTSIARSFPLRTHAYRGDVRHSCKVNPEPRARTSLRFKSHTQSIWIIPFADISWF